MPYNARRSARRDGIGVEDSGLGGEAIQLRASLETKLLAQPRPIGLHRLHAQADPLGDLLIRVSLAPTARSTSRSRWLSFFGGCPARRLSVGASVWPGPTSWVMSTNVRPAWTARMADSNSESAAFLTRYPDAPADSAARRYAASSCMVRISTRVVGQARRTARMTLAAAGTGHREIEQDDVGPQLSGALRDFQTVRRFAHDVDVALRIRATCEVRRAGRNDRRRSARESGSWAAAPGGRPCGRR